MKIAPVAQSPATTASRTGPDTTILTTEQLKKLPNQHTSLHAIINLHSLTDLCELSKLHQNNLYALTGLNTRKNQAQQINSQCRAGGTL